MSDVFKNKTITAMAIILFNTAFAQESISALKQKNPEYIAKVGNMRNHFAPLKEFRAQEGISAFVKISASHWEPIVVDSFLFMISRNDSVIFQYKNRGYKFENLVKSALGNLHKNDSILIYGIYARGASGEKILLNPLEFLIE